MFFESHAHYDDRRFKNDREEIIASLQENDIGCVINVGASVDSSEASVKLAEKYSFIYASVGVHPHYVKTLNEKDLTKLENLSTNPKVVAVGEIGLDFFRDLSPRDVQRHWFKKQLELSKKLNLPTIIHSRDASAETFNIIKNSDVREGVIHCYSGSAPMALDYIEMGFYIGICGVITFDKTRKLTEVVKSIPLERIQIETDSPYLTPAPHRSERNNSNYLIFIANKIAEIKGISTQCVADTTFSNACNLFSIDPGSITKV